MLPRKLELLEQYGLDAAIVQPFTLDYAKTSAAEFEKSLLDDLGAKHLVVGIDFTYGAERRGTVELLRQAAAQRGASVELVAPVAVDGVVISSTKIREYILEGRVHAAERLLGRYFDLDGSVVPGQGRGRRIGFPTANVDTANEVRPGPGVYAFPPDGPSATVGAARARPTGPTPRTTRLRVIVGGRGGIYWICG